MAKNELTYGVMTGDEFIAMVRPRPQLWKSLTDAIVTHVSLGNGYVVAIQERPDYAPLLSLNFEKHSDSGLYNGDAFFGGSRVSYVYIPLEITSRWMSEHEWRSQDKRRRNTLTAKFACEFWELLCARKYESGKKLSRPLTMRDASLLLAWADSTLPIELPLNRSSLVSHLGEQRANRLCSARAAEICSRDYYRALGRKVTDISVGQLYRGEDWREFDLMVGNQPVDVKNARKSFFNPETYIEHYIPKFKESRQVGDAVRICGVLSDYGNFEDICEGNIQCRVLGEISKPQLFALKSWMTNRFGSLLSLDGLWRDGYQPGWMFEYPREHYYLRDMVVLEAPKAVQHFLNLHEKVPRWLISLSPKFLISCGQSDSELDLLSDLHSLREGVGFSRPSLYLFAMGRILEDLSHNVPIENSSASIFKEYLFADVEGSYLAPLGLEDSQGYVHSLLERLANIYEHVAQSGKRFKSFRLIHPDILIGQDQEDEWCSLIAYCGGWRVSKKVKCGYTPLVFGINENCPQCKHLVCPKCGYCSSHCVLCEQRQISAARIKTDHDQE
ncbi:MAG: hypothetical protein PHN28_15110 [Aquabacterium sp.]|nr:hypothetical protein [Aquabacterium sp.]